MCWRTRFTTPLFHTQQPITEFLKIAGSNPAYAHEELFVFRPVTKEVCYYIHSLNWLDPWLLELVDYLEGGILTIAMYGTQRAKDSSLHSSLASSCISDYLNSFVRPFLWCFPSTILTYLAEEYSAWTKACQIIREDRKFGNKVHSYTRISPKFRQYRSISKRSQSEKSLNTIALSEPNAATNSSREAKSASISRVMPAKHSKPLEDKGRTRASHRWFVRVFKFLYDGQIKYMHRSRSNYELGSDSKWKSIFEHRFRDSRLTLTTPLGVELPDVVDDWGWPLPRKCTPCR